jgi:hypothetical protein
VASHKFALLLALADLSVENGDDSGAALLLGTEAIAQRFVQYYWRQSVPYPAAAEARVLKQNTGRQAAILNKVMWSREQYGDSITELMKHPTTWNRLVRQVASVIQVMPLWKLQTVGRARISSTKMQIGAERSNSGRVWPSASASSTPLLWISYARLGCVTYDSRTSIFWGKLPT